MYYFYGLMKFCSKPNILAVLLIVGGASVITFVPWGLGLLLLPDEGAPWIIGAGIIALVAMSLFTLVGIYLLAVEQIKKWQR